MKQLLQYPRDAAPRAVDVPDPTAGRGMIVIETRASLISAGTERASVRLARASLLEKARARPDLVRQVWRKARTEGFGATWRKVSDRLAEPLAPGYSAAGVVIDCGEDGGGIRAGDRVAVGGQGYAAHAERLCVPRNLVCELPPGVSFVEGAFVAVGAVALQGIRTTGPQLGETVAVVGLGLLGQLTCRLLSAQGCRVIGIDPDQARRETAAKSAGARTVAPHDADRFVAELSGGLGVDSVIICAASDSDDIIRDAASIARDRAVITVVGAVPLNVPRAEFYRKELQLRLSRSYGPGRYDHAYEERGIDYPPSYVRWTENRNMAAFLDLVAGRRIEVMSLITHRFALADAEGAYQALEKSHDALGVVFECPDAPAATPVIRRLTVKGGGVRKDTFGVGFWGAGRFASGVLAPIFRARPETRLIGVAARTPASAEKAMRQHGFGYATCRGEELLADSDIDIVVIATPHHEHAAMARAALAAGKTVFLEKPAATDREQIRMLTQAVSSVGGRLQVGFNRRYAPASLELRAAFAAVSGPKTIIYRVNAGPAPTSGWLSDPEQGGRLVGEVGHFVDTSLFLAGSWPKRVFAERQGPDNSDGVVILLTMVDGSVATIIYATDAQPQTPKEHIEVVGGGITGVIDDFSRWSIHPDPATGKPVERKRAQDKGHSAQIAAMLEALRNERLAAGDWAAAVSATEVTFAARDSVRTGMPVDIEQWL